jgi:hypothetical protein
MCYDGLFLGLDKGVEMHVCGASNLSKRRLIASDGHIDGVLWNIFDSRLREETRE